MTYKLPEPENEGFSDGCTFDCPEGWSKEQVLAAYAAGLAEGAPKWLPIESAPEGQLVVTYWSDEAGSYHNFDYLEDEVWQNHFSEHEHYKIAGVAKGRSEDAPYTHWMPLPAAPETKP